MKKITHEEYVARLEINNPTVKVIELYINANTPILHHCEIHNIDWNITPYRALQGNGCKECKKERFYKSRCKSQQTYINEVKNVNSNIEVIGQYIGANKKILHRCKLHNIEWDAFPSNILKGCGCKECQKEKTSIKNGRTHKEYIRDLIIRNPGVDVVGNYVNTEISIMHRCKKCGYEWLAKPGNILHGKGCPICCESHGEKIIGNYLKNNNINYIPQYTFNECKFKKLLPFDFYLPKYNLCIEYQGEQHYRAIDFFGGEEEFNLRKKRDEIKQAYCQSHNIRLLQIPYWEDVEKYLNNNLLI